MTNPTAHKYAVLEQLANKGLSFPQDPNQLPVKYPIAKPLSFGGHTSPKPDGKSAEFSNHGDLEDEDDRYVFFFDIDNCLYPQSSRIHQLMQKYIHDYFVNHLSLDDYSAEKLHQQYYKDYGLALEGLVRFHNIKALEYNKEVDDALPLEHILRPDPALRLMLQSIDRTKVKKLWLFTNAYKNHGNRCVKLLGIDDLFDGITYCDYGQVPLICKPKAEMFDKVMKEAGVPFHRKDRCLYVDDSALNVEAAIKYGWTSGSVQYVDSDQALPKTPAGTHVIRSILDLPIIFPEIFVADGVAEFAHLIAQPAYDTEIPVEIMIKMAQHGQDVPLSGMQTPLSTPAIGKGVVHSGLEFDSGMVTPGGETREPSTHHEKRQIEQRRYSTQILDMELEKLKQLEIEEATREAAAEQELERARKRQQLQ